MITYSSCKFKDADGGEMTIKLRDVSDSTKLHTLAKVIEGASTASFVTRRFEEAESSPVAPTAGSKVSYMGILSLKDANGQIYKVTIPSVNPTVVEKSATNPKNEVVNETTRNAIATAYGTATGKSGVNCISSRVIQKNYA